MALHWQLSQLVGAVLRFRGVTCVELGQVLLMCGGQELPGGVATWPQRPQAQRALGESLPSTSPGFPLWPEPETGVRMFSEAGTFEP